MPNLQPPDAGTRARKRFYHRHYYPLQFPGNLLTVLMKAAVALQKHPDQVVGTALQHFLALSAEEQEASLAAYERYAPSGQDTPGNDIANEPRTDPGCRQEDSRKIDGNTTGRSGSRPNKRSRCQWRLTAMSLFESPPKGTMP